MFEHSRIRTMDPSAFIANGAWLPLLLNNSIIMVMKARRSHDSGSGRKKYGDVVMPPGFDALRRVRRKDSEYHSKDI